MSKKYLKKKASWLADILDGTQSHEIQDLVGESYHDLQELIDWKETVEYDFKSGRWYTDE
jgi:hypothetical protein